MKRLFIVFFIAFGCLNLLEAQDSVNTHQELMKFSLDELLKIKVTAPSKTAKSWNETPGSVTIYSKNQIRHFGYYNLSDLAGITAGYGQSMSQYAELGLETRGQAAPAFENDRHVVLIDDIPIYFARSYKAPIDYDLPIYSAENIQFLKGPASALYGASAFYGIIQINSKTAAKDRPYGEIRLSRSPSQNGNRLMLNAGGSNETAEFNIAIGRYDREASMRYLGIGIQDDRFRYYDDQESNFIHTSFRLKKGKLEGLSFGFVYMQRRTSLGEFWFGPPNQSNEIKWTTAVPYIKLDKKLSKKLQLKSYLYYNNSKEDGLFFSQTPFQIPDSLGTYRYGSDYLRNTSDVQINSNLEFNINENQSFIAGLTADVKWGAGLGRSYDNALYTPDTITNTPRTEFSYLEEIDGSIQTYSLYAQYQLYLNLLEGLEFTFGAREDVGVVNNQSFNQLSPRFASVLKLNEKLSWKLLYNEALRVPTVKIIGLNQEAQRTITSLGGPQNVTPIVQAENIQSLESSFSFKSNKLAISLTGFYNNTSNMIGKEEFFTTIQGEDIRSSRFSNLDGNVEAIGGELELFARVNNFIRGFSNVSYAEANFEGQFFDYIPRLKSNFGLTALSQKRGFAVTGILRMINGIQTPDNTMDQFISDYMLFDFNTIIPIYEKINIELQVRNVFDQLYYHPGTNYENIQYLIPQNSRSFNFTLEFRY